MDKITQFRGEYDFLSNFFRKPLMFDELEYPAAENAYQASKLVCEASKIPFTTCTPKEAKKMGRSIELRSDWEDVKIGILKEILFRKFEDPELRAALLKTGAAVLIEGNTWHDNFYGNCTCSTCTGTKGQNHLGWLLMEVRGEIARLEAMKRQSPAQLQQTFYNCRLLPEDRLTLHMSWDDLTDASSNLLSKLLLRDVKTEINREDYYYWYARVLNEPLSIQEADFLVDALRIELDWSEYVCVEDGIEELNQYFLHALFTAILPFPNCYTYADDNGVSFVSNLESAENTFRAMILNPDADSKPNLLEIRAKGDVQISEAFQSFKSALEPLHDGDRLYRLDRAAEETMRRFPVAIQIKPVQEALEIA